jgi:hypothetical protein
MDEKTKMDFAEDILQKLGFQFWLPGYETLKSRVAR